ncbi:MAG: rSAM/selenodomain-associated transferase 2 [Planctomycetota bacterium]
MIKISIIVPCLNEAASIQSCLSSLQFLRANGHEVIVVDGSSNDATVSLAKDMADYVLVAPRGRARQLNFGADKATGSLLLFLHADTLLPEDAEARLNEVVGSEFLWGRFDVRLSGAHILFRLIEYFMNIRSRVTGIATGDQAIFVSRELFEYVGGFPDIELMEDIAFSKKLKKMASPICLRDKVLTSSRRWEKVGIIKTVFKMSLLRLRYALGVKPDKLARDYE